MATPIIVRVATNNLLTVEPTKSSTVADQLQNKKRLYHSQVFRIRTWTLYSRRVSSVRRIRKMTSLAMIVNCLV